MATVGSTNGNSGSSKVSSESKGPSANATGSVASAKAADTTKTAAETKTAGPVDSVSISKDADASPEPSDSVASLTGAWGDMAAAGADQTADQPEDRKAAGVEAIGGVLAADHAEWGGQVTTANGRTIERGHRENENGFSEKVAEYHEGTAVEGKTGKDRDVPWSASYISSVHDRAGVTNFPASASHSTYIKAAIEARGAGDTEAPYVGYRPTERAPQVGDMVCFNRENGNVSFDNQPEGFYASHCDIVREVGPGGILTQGGNVGDSVSVRTFTTDADGLLNDASQNFIAVLAAQNLEMR